VDDLAATNAVVSAHPALVRAAATDDSIHFAVLGVDVVVTSIGIQMVLP
jgi:hypothetical protein